MIRMGWKNWSYTRKGMVLGIILFFISVIYFGVVRVIIDLGELRCSTQGLGFEQYSPCKLGLIPRYILLSSIFWGIPLFLVSLLIGFIIRKIKSET